MSAVRSVLLLGLPGIAVVLGILWYHKRKPKRSDPGGGGSMSKKETELLSNLVITSRLTSSEAPATPSVTVIGTRTTPARDVPSGKSAPIDIQHPSGSSIELTDDQIDLEILKIKSQKSQGRDGVIMSSSADMAMDVVEPVVVQSEQKVLEAECNHQEVDTVIGDSGIVTSDVGEDMDVPLETENKPEDGKESKCDWSQELCELENKADRTLNGSSVRDSAYHSPTENLASSPQLSLCSDRHSERSSDSGKGSSPPRSVAPVIFEFALSQRYIGRLIGRNGAFINQIKSQTNANVLVKRHPDTNKLKICAVEGSQSEIDAALPLIRSKFPESRYPSVSLQPVSIQHPLSSLELTPECLGLQLVEGVNNDCTVSCVITGGLVSVQQPLHPTFPSLNLLQYCMSQAYSTIECPSMPMPIGSGVLCACSMDGQWYRAQVTGVPSPEEVAVRFVDFGDRLVVPVSQLRQIRADFMTLPFQATDCLLANVSPVGGANDWSEEAAQDLSTLTQHGGLLQVQIYGFLDDTPLVHIYCCIAPNQVMFINEELVARGLADWVEPEL